MFENLERNKQSLQSKFYFNYNTSNSNWFRAGGNAKVFIIVENSNELVKIIKLLKGINYLVIGAGSNFLVRDTGYDGAIIKLGKGFNKLSLEEDSVNAGSSILDINLSKFAKKHSIKNFEFLSGIPGTIGGAIKMNAGCFGSEIKDILNKVEIIDLNGNQKEVQANKLNLQYRSSNLKDTDIVTLANFKLSYGSNSFIEKKINSIKNNRNTTQPLNEITSGSTFKNPINHHAAKLIEDSGCKGLEVGDAIVSYKHANFLINRGKATATHIEELGKKIIDKVFKKYGILLEWEIKLIGDKKNE